LWLRAAPGRLGYDAAKRGSPIPAGRSIQSLDGMKSAAAFIGGVLVFVVALWAVGRIFAPTPLMAWVPFLISIAAVLAIILRWPAKSQIGRFGLMILSSLLVAAVLVSDLFIAVYYSCAHHVCM
jgi:hypothetical protein